MGKNLRLKIDLHVHTIYSKDSLIKIEDIVPRCKALGIDGIAVTDHETLKGGVIAVEKCAEILVIPGMEIETQQGHVLGLNLEKRVKGGLSFIETIKRIKELGGTAIIAHPYSLIRPLLDVDILIASKPNAIEVANAASFPYSWMLRINQALASKVNLPMTGGSDAHIPQTIGRAYTLVDSDSRDVSDILKAVREGRTDVQGRGITLQERFQKIIKWNK